MRTPTGGDAPDDNVDGVDVDGVDAVAAALAAKYAAAVAGVASAEAEVMAVLAPPAAKPNYPCGHWPRSWGRVRGNRTGRCSGG
ncbi:MAG: hypothetical protein DI573_13245 [Microbacterium sp.]|uniref:hypothetical protein n=1 Tax=Microbacterium sp. TaxID=51671 RepID=UPI000DB55CD1|nr:hypothetical protein [Microbacterium sp.]PZU36650.1 MAG: hypothetical protein DI573_13245 [Microbacterium sp.]